MLRTKIVPAALAVSFVLAAAGGANAGSDKKENDLEVSMIRSAKVSLREAVTAAEQKIGGRAMKIGLEDSNGSMVYEVAVVMKDKVTEVTIDPMTGKVTKAGGKSMIGDLLDDDDEEDLVNASNASIPLLSAITAAETASGGKAIEAEAEGEDGKLLYEVEILKNDNSEAEKIYVDGFSGKIVTASTDEGSESDDD